MEENARYVRLVNPIFAWLERPKGQAVTSTITMLELLVQPYKLPDMDRVNKFYALLSTYPHLHWIDPTLEIADSTARLRAEYNLRTPDALQAAAALVCEAAGFISNDAGFKKVAGFEVAILEELVNTKATTPDR